jgi:class 3 adenylate cyclase/tetratricopeptide (TPR) repeat protein
MITKKGQLKIMDFGLAKVFEETDVTKTASIMGTVSYMSPEQAQGENVDHRTDIWSAGVVLYEALTAQLPFLGNNPGAVLHSVINKFPKPPSEIIEDIPSGLDRIVLKCLRKNVEDRYSSANRLLSDLNDLLDREKGVKKDFRVAEKREIYKESERRQATVVFAKVSGYEELQEKFDPEEAALIMNSCFDMFTSIIEKYGGRKYRIMGNRYSALFGIPVAIENAPIEAVNSAIEMRNELYKLNAQKKLRPSLDIHIGIDSGVVIAGPLSPDGKEYSVTGTSINTASQLMDLTGRGKIYVGPLTHRYSQGGFTYQQLKPVPLPGKKEAVPIYELLSEKETLYREEFVLDRTINSEMVGRQRELDKLEYHVLKVINNEGSVVNVIGEAGIGKSRLIAELLEKESIKKVLCLRGRALSFGKNLSYYPIIDVLKCWASIQEDDSEIESATKIEETIRQICPDDVDGIFPFIATLMGITLIGKNAERVKGIEGDAMEKLILKSIRELIISGAKRHPLLIILEDLHWSDITTVELLESLYRLAENNRILFVNIFRPNYKDTSDRLQESIRDRCPGFHTDIFLEPLDEKQCDLLIHNLLKATGIPQNVKTAIAHSAEGNPFFIEEVLRSFIDEGIVEHRGGKFKITEKIDSVIIPETIKDVIMSRIDRLDENTKSLLKKASVIGRYFFYKILMSVVKITEDVDERLGYLQRIQLIQKRKRLEEVEYLFKHALAHEITYESILIQQRRELHIKVAKAIESVFPDRLYEFYGMLAFHYSRGDEMEKAEEYLLKAGEEALKAAASYEALNYFREAMKLYLRKLGDDADPEKIADLNKKIAIALYFKGHLAESVEHFDRALEYWEGKRPESKIIANVKLLIDLLLMMKELYLPSKKPKKIPGKLENEIMESSYRKQTALVPIDTHRMFTEALGLFRRMVKFDLTKIKHGVAAVSGFSAIFSYSGVSLTIGRKILDYTKEYLAKSDEKGIFAYNYWKLVCNYLSGDWSQKEDFNEGLIDSMVVRGEAWNATGYITILGFINIELGNFSTAQKCCDKLKEIAEIYEDDYARVRNYYVYTRLLLRKGKLGEVVSVAEEGVPFIAKVGQPLAVLFLLGMKANAQILLKDISGAESSLLQAEELVLQEKRISPLMISSYLTSQFLLSLFKLERASGSGERAKMKEFRKTAQHFGKTALKNSEKYVAEKTKVLRLMGSYFWITGRQESAFAWWEKSIALGEKISAQPELARTYMEVGKRLMDEKCRIKQLRGTDSEGYLEKARNLFTESEMRTVTDELDRMLVQRHH